MWAAVGVAGASDFSGYTGVRPNPPPLSVRSPSSGFGLTFLRGIGFGLG